MTAAEVLVELTRRYHEPHRHYHTLAHIAQMLQWGQEPGLSPEQILAIWFHDAVYDPGSATNEEDSAALARELLADAPAGHDAIDLVAVERMILDTKDHRPTAPGSDLVIDLDLAGLALPWPEFESNRRKIRAEYSWVPEPEYAAGTLAFAEGFLLRERIFSTGWGEPREGPARANLGRLADCFR